MGEETIIEGQVTDVTAEEKQNVAKAAAGRASTAAAATAAALKGAVGSVGKSVAAAVSDRDHVVIVRVSRDTLRQLDMLVEGEVTRNRSESITFMIAEGIKANQGLFERIGSIADQIAAMRSQAREAVEGQSDKPPV